MLLGILMATMTNKTGFERRERFLPSCQPRCAAFSSPGGFPTADLTQLRIKPTHPPLAPLTPPIVLFKTEHRASVHIAALGLKEVLYGMPSTLVYKVYERIERRPF